MVFSLFSVPAQAQQVNEYQICTKYRETYVPGYYDVYGNYIRGSVRTVSYRVPCTPTTPVVQTDAVQQPIVVQQPVVVQQLPPYYSATPGYYNGGVYCNPTRSALGALLGGGIAASMSRGNGYYWSVPVGAAIGGAIFGCNRY